MQEDPAGQLFKKRKMRETYDHFADYETSKMAKELGFDIECIGTYQQMNYPVNDSGNDYNKSLCLTIDCETGKDEQKILWIEKENAHFHWHEGTYSDGEHSRCELLGEDCPAPLWHQLQEWLWEKYNMYIDITQLSTEDDEENYYQANVSTPHTYKGNHVENSSPFLAMVAGVKEAIRYNFNQLQPPNPNKL